MPEEEEEEDEVITEVAEYSPKSDFSKALIVKEAVQKCIEARGKEMRAGYWNIKATNEGIQKEYKPDTRKTYIGTIDALRNLLSPEIKMNEAFQKVEEKIRKKIDSLYNTFAYKEKKVVIKYDERTGNNMPVWKETGVAYLPDIDEILPHQNAKPGEWNPYVNAYWNARVEEYDKLFALLNDLLHSRNYFKSQISF